MPGPDRTGSGTGANENPSFIIEPVNEPVGTEPDAGIWWAASRPGSWSTSSCSRFQRSAAMPEHRFARPFSWSLTRMIFSLLAF